MTDPTSMEPDPRAVGLSWIRTAVPYLWAYALTWLATRWPQVADFLSDPMILSAVVGVAGSLWYLLFRWLEKRLPGAFIRILLGSPVAPVYPRPVESTDVRGLHIPKQAEGR